MKDYYIYKIICLCDEWNGKFYIGKHYGTLDDNYTGSGKLIKDYFSKYDKIKGLTYDKQILEVGNENSICDLERDFFREGMKSELCLNIKCVSSKGVFGHKHSENSRKKMSESKKGMKRKPLSTEHKRKLSEIKKGKQFSAEHRKHLSESKKGMKRKPFSEEHKKHIGESRKGMKYKKLNIK